MSCGCSGIDIAPKSHHDEPARTAAQRITTHTFHTTWSPKKSCAPQNGLNMVPTAGVRGLQGVNAFCPMLMHCRWQHGCCNYHADRSKASQSIQRLVTPAPLIKACYLTLHCCVTCIDWHPAQAGALEEAPTTNTGDQTSLSKASGCIQQKIIQSADSDGIMRQQLPLWSAGMPSMQNTQGTL